MIKPFVSKNIKVLDGWLIIGWILKFLIEYSALMAKKIKILVKK